MLLLGTWTALAADLPPGSHVLVRRGAAIGRVGGGWSAVPSVEAAGWPAEVRADDGDSLRIRLDTDGCTAPLAAAAVLDVELVVQESDLLPVVAAPAGGTLPDGDAWHVE